MPELYLRIVHDPFLQVCSWYRDVKNVNFLLQ